MTYSDLIRAASQLPEFEFDSDAVTEPGWIANARTLVRNNRLILEDARRAIAARPAVPTQFSADYFSSHAQELQSMRLLARSFRLAGS